MLKEAAEQRKHAEQEESWRRFSESSSDNGPSSLAAVLACLGLLFGVCGGADAGGWVPAIGGIVGCCIGFGLGKVVTFVFRAIADRF